MLTAPTPRMRPVYKKRIRNNKSAHVVLFNYAYGATASRIIEGPGAFAVGSIIPGGRFVVRAPSPNGYSTNTYRTAMLPDRTGKYLTYPNGSDYSQDIAPLLNDDNEFCEVLGVSVTGSNTCKSDCVKSYCCPIGYEGEEQSQNYWNPYENITIVDSGKATVYTETDMKSCDKVYMRIEVIDTNATVCQMLGGVTNTPDAGTQEICVKVAQAACAGEAVLLDLSGLKNCK